MPEKTNEIICHPDLLDHLAETKPLKGALVTIDAWAARSTSQDHRLQGRLPAPSRAISPTWKRRSPTTFAAIPKARSLPKPLSKRATAVSRPARIRPLGNVDWIASERSYPGQRASPASRPSSGSTAEPSMLNTPPSTRATTSVRPRHPPDRPGHPWPLGRRKHALAPRHRIRPDLSRYRSGHGAKNMAVVRRFALGLVPANKAREASRRAERAQAGIPHSCSKSSAHVR